MKGQICPHCKKTIDDDDALMCLYCGKRLKAKKDVLGWLRFVAPALVLVTVAALIALFVFLFGQIW